MNFKREDRDSILIVDDVTSNLVTLVDIIREAGYIARPVSSVEQASRAIEASMPDVILLDVTMPIMNGYEYCTELKKNVRTRDIPVIFISGLNTPQDRVRGFECGAVDFISKPFERTEVLMRMSTHLNTAHLQKNLTDNNKKLHALVNRQLIQIENERKHMIMALARLTEARVAGSEQHIDNVARNTRLITTGLSLTHKYEKVISNDFISSMEIASRLHDLGKCLLPDRVVLKTEGLNEEEEALIRTHTVMGVEALTTIYTENSRNNLIKMAIDMSHYHHERWDGTGYPDGKKGTEIPLSARIVAVVDVYDVLLDRGRDGHIYTHEEAIEAIRNDSGKAFDPDVVSIFCRLEKRLARDGR